MILGLVKNNNTESDVTLVIIRGLNNYSCVKNAKEYFNQNKEGIWEALYILVTADEDGDLNYIHSGINQQPKKLDIKYKLKDDIRKI